MNRSALLLPALLLALAACGGGDEAATSQATQSSGARAAGSGAAMRQVEAEMAEISDYRLTMDAVQGWHEAQRSVYRQVQGNPELARQLSVESDDPTLDDLEDHYASIPEVTEAIEDAGLEVREFVLIIFSLTQAAGAQQLIESGMSQDSVLNRLDVHPDNLEFVRQNQARLQQLQQETDALMPPELGDQGEEYDEDY